VFATVAHNHTHILTKDPEIVAAAIDAVIRKVS